LRVFELIDRAVWGVSCDHREGVGEAGVDASV